VARFFQSDKKIKTKKSEVIVVFVDKIKSMLNINEVQTSGRNLYIDALKGITIIIVVFAHSVQINDPAFSHNPFYLTFVPFAMPLFMLLSGFIIVSQLGNTFLGYLKKYGLRLIVPFFIWAFVSYGFFHFYRDVSLPVYIWSVAKFPGTHLWFLWALFLNSVLLFVALKLSRLRDWSRFENYFVIGAILLSRLASSDFFGLSEVKQYFPYYAAGFFLCKYWDEVKARRRIFFAIGIIGFPLLVLGYRRNELPTFYPFLLDIFGETGIARLLVSIYKYVLAFMGMALAAFLLSLIRSTRFYLFLCWVGTLTLDIYVCHRYFLNMGLGSDFWQYFSAALLAFIGSLVLTLFVLRRFRITRLLFLGLPFSKK